jgi:uncharacterized protein YecT (DUF1311 family)
MVKTQSLFYLHGLLMITTSLMFSYACAIDNPDAVDLMAGFEQREEPFLKKIDKSDNSNRAYLIAYDDYQIFLDKELNNAYGILMKHLPDAQKKELKQSQRNWIKFRDAEFRLIKNNWTRDNFGSSAAVLRGSYRTTLIKNRVMQLLHYAQNY